MDSIDRKMADRIKTIARLSLSAIVVVTILMFSLTKADAQEGQDAGNKMVKKEISKMLQLPVDVMVQLADRNQEEVEVRISLTVDQDGSIDVNQVQSGSELLSDYVKNELNDKTLKRFKDGSASDYMMIIQFKTI